ncbi:hypothetical protein GMMP13_1000029 [Candidatus Magnetomoraceae bacterium gMMP-13]
MSKWKKIAENGKKLLENDENYWIGEVDKLNKLPKFTDQKQINIIDNNVRGYFRIKSPLGISDYKLNVYKSVSFNPRYEATPFSLSSRCSIIYKKEYRIFIHVVPEFDNERTNALREKFHQNKYYELDRKLYPIITEYRISYEVSKRKIKPYSILDKLILWYRNDYKFYWAKCQNVSNYFTCVRDKKF